LGLGEAGGLGRDTRGGAGKKNPATTVTSEDNGGRKGAGGSLVGTKHARKLGSGELRKGEPTRKPRTIFVSRENWEGKNLGPKKFEQPRMCQSV